MPPLTIMVKPASGLCNMRCDYCFYSDVMKHRSLPSYGVMTEETLETLVRRALTYADGQLNLAFQGGEPTLAGKPFFRKLLKLEKQYRNRSVRISHALQTNGYALDEEWMEIFKEGHFLVGVSLDGTKELHNLHRADAYGKPTYDKVQQSLRLLKSAGVDYNILCVVTRQAAENAEAVWNELESHVYMQFIPCIDSFDGNTSTWSLDAEAYGRFLIRTFDLYERSLRAERFISVRTFDNWVSMLMGYPSESCALGGRCGIYWLVEADGSVYPCDFYVLDKWRLGNILSDNLFRLEKSPLVGAFLKDSETLPNECMHCRWLTICRGGCKRDREPIINGIPSANRLCAGHKLFFEARMERLRGLAEFFAKR